VHCLCGGFESAYSAVASLNPPMILFQMVVEVTIRPVHHLVPEAISYGPWISIMPVGGDTRWRHPRHSPCGAQKRLGRGEVPCATGAPIDQVSVPISGRVEILPPPLDFRVCLIDIPGSALYGLCCNLIRRES
jgi:hypothetical protein